MRSPWVQSLNRAVAAIGETLLSLKNVDVVHTSPPPGQRKLEPGKRAIAAVKAQDALVGFFEDEKGAPFSIVVNKRHGLGKSADELKDTLELELAEDVTAVEVVGGQGPAAGPLELKERRAKLELGGGSGALLRIKTKAR